MVIEWGVLLEIAICAGVISTLLYDVPHSYRERRRLAGIVDKQEISIILGEHQLLALNNPDSYTHLTPPTTLRGKVVLLT